ncbi:MAG: DUF655 domain-containing protein [Candidatus Lokiarchaeia archaeon]
MMLSSKKYEEFAYVLDNLPQGYANDPRPTFQREPVTQAVGETYFTLLELVPRKGVSFSLHERIYIGKGSRKKIDHVQRRILYDDLTPTAKSELPFVIEKIVMLREKKFVHFFNNARPITTRMHQLKLIPGIGRKTMWLILEERKKESFKSFENINNRVRMPEPKKAIVNRILSELKEEDKYRLFTRPPTTSQE